MSATSYRTAPEVGIDHLLRQAVFRAPDKTALIDDDSDASFAAIDRQANRLAHALRERGIQAGERAAIVLPNGIPFIVAEIALLRLGLVKVPLNIRFAIDEVMYAAADCAPTILIATPGYAKRILDRRAELPSLLVAISVGGEIDGALDWQELIEGPALPDLPAVPYDDDAPILIRYTGGTTGRPKGVVHTHRSYCAIVLDVVRENRLCDTDTALHLGHLSHGLNFMWPAWFLSGATQVLREHFDAVAVWQDFVRHRIAWVYMVPTMIHMLLDADDGRVDVSSLRNFTYASAPMPVPLLRRAIERFGNIFCQVYTLSEAPVITTIMRAEEHLEIETECGPRLASIGREVPSFALRLIDDDGNDVMPGEAGEIAVFGVNTMAGYWNLPQETARTFVDGWLRTGDMARRASDGFLYLVDRKKDIVITGGFNVWPKEVEDVLLRHPDVAQVGVVGAPDEKWGEIVVAYVVPWPGANLDTEELLDLCREHLADYKKPRRLHVVASLPLTPVGKISRAELRKLARAGS